MANLDYFRGSSLDGRSAQYRGSDDSACANQLDNTPRRCHDLLEAFAGLIVRLNPLSWWNLRNLRWFPSRRHRINDRHLRADRSALGEAEARIL